MAAAIRSIQQCLVPLLPLLLWLTIASGLDDCGGSNGARIVSFTAVPRYHVVQFLVDQDMRRRSEVRAFNFSYHEFHMHVFHAVNAADDLSFAAVNPETEAIVGVNLVLRYPKLGDMYAPTSFIDILDLVRNCYRWKMGPNVDKTYIRILEASETPWIQCRLLKEAVARYKSLKPAEKGGYLLWSSAIHNGALLRRLGYRSMGCSESKNPCDWTKLNIPRSVASDICLFGL